MDFLQKLSQIREIATLPTVAFRILELIDDPRASAQDVTRLIETDVATTMKILKVANSSLYGVRSEITSIQQAVVTLGLNRISNIAVSVALFSQLFSASVQQGVFMNEYWRHSCATGIVARTLASKLKINLSEREFVGGLLHDVGKMVMIQFFPEEFARVVEKVETELLSDVEAERAVFGVDHNAAGEVIAKMWKLPSDLLDVIVHHTNVDAAENPGAMLPVVRIADLLCEIWGAGIHEGIRELELEQEKVWNMLCDMRPSLRELDVEVFTFELEEEFKKAEEFISLMIAP